MDPNNNKPINTNPLGQFVAQPVQPTPPASSPAQTPELVVAAPEPTPTPQPKSGSKKGLILIIILLILIIGAISYVLFAKKQLSNTQKTSTNTSAVIPTAIPPTATPATVNEINVENPDTDLIGIDKDVQGL